MGELLTLTVENFEREAVRSPLPLLIEIYSDHYPSCRRMSAVVEALAVRYRGRVRFGRIDVDDQPLLAGQLSIAGMPCALIMKKGRIYHHIGGLLPSAVYERLLDRLLADSRDEARPPRRKRQKPPSPDP